MSAQSSYEDIKTSLMNLYTSIKTPSNNIEHFTMIGVPQPSSDMDARYYLPNNIIWFHQRFTVLFKILILILLY